MDFLELLLESISTLTVNKMRTGLAALGIIIGIGSVITLIALGQASQKSVEEQIQSLGANLLTISPTAQVNQGIRGAAGTGITLSLEDAQAIQDSEIITTVKSVSPEYSGRLQVVAGRNNVNTQIIGVTPQYAEIRNVDLADGVFITEHNVQAQARVAVLGSQAAIDLFGEEVYPVGQTIRINGQVLRVVGITLSKGGTSFNNLDDAIFVPLSTAQRQLFGATHLTSIAVAALNPDVMALAQDQIGYLLLERRNISDPALADFSIFSQHDILDTASAVTGTFTTLLGGIAAISLLVGGIGIMNIMLVTVTERTREIGLRKALGAKKKVIITQFLVETVILTVVSGFTGMVLGIAGSYFISSAMNLPFVLSVRSMMLAIGVSGGIGVIFGWYPAQKAAKLQPIEALRYE
jgi:putative ABC transport system permease protein